MITIAKLIMVGLCGFALGCNSRSAPPTESAAVAEAHDEEPSTDANVVQVDVGMMRDLRITTQAVESRSGVEEVSLLGELGVDQGRYAEVSTPLAARVTRLIVNAGDSVAAGAPLAELASSELGKARADYLSATARVTLAESALKRKQDLAAERIAPAREVQEAEAAVAEAHASQRSALAALAAFGVPAPTTDAVLRESSVFHLRSPVRGSVIERNAVVGQMLDPATAAFRVGDLSTLWLSGHAFERDAVRIRKGATARVTFPALPGQNFPGTVNLVGREVERESRTIPIRITVQNLNGVLRPGMSASAGVPVGESGVDILAVPVGSVQRVRNEWCVFLPRATGTFEIRRIGRGRDLGAEVEVLTGLKAGETVVVDGAFLLKAQAEKGSAGHDEH